MNLVVQVIIRRGLALVLPITHPQEPNRNLLSLSLSETRVTDAGLAHLQKLKGLRNLYLKGTKVTSQGVADLRKVLPDLEIDR
jgi:hypothetical protein